MQSTMASASRRAASLVRLAVHGAPARRALSSLSGESFLSGTSAVYVEEMYAAYKQNPSRCVGL